MQTEFEKQNERSFGETPLFGIYRQDKGEGHHELESDQLGPKDWRPPYKVQTRKREDGYSVTNDPEKVNIDKVYEYLNKESYWANGIPRQLVSLSLHNSICFSILSPEGEFVGFSRVVTDL